MSRARVHLHPVAVDLVLGPLRVRAGTRPEPIECSYEDCLGTMLPKFYYPAEPREVPVHDHYGRACGTKREPSYQVPADAIEKVEADEEACARWERLHAAEVAVAEQEKKDILVLCHCEHRRDDHGREGSWPCFRCECAEFEPDFFGNEEDVCRRCGVESEAHAPGPCTYESELRRDPSDTTVYACTGCGGNVCPAEGDLGALCPSCEQDRRDGKLLESDCTCGDWEVHVPTCPWANMARVKPIDTTASGKQWVLPVPAQAPSFFGPVPGPVPVGTPHEPDYAEEPRTTNGAAPALTAEELHAAYARGGK